MAMDVKHNRMFCKFNLGVLQDEFGCTEEACASCGWNPEVEAVRKEEIYRKHGYANGPEAG